MTNDKMSVLCTITEINEALSRLGDASVAETLARFFKTGPGEYGFGDRFRGIRVPQLRKLAATVVMEDNVDIPERLLVSQWHEDRLLALLLLVRWFDRSPEPQKKRLFDFYMAHTGRINNWDLVDLSAPYVPGPYLFDRTRKILFTMAESPVLWDRRIALLSTFHFIRKNDFDDTLGIVKRYLGDNEDLIHKASGWMLREIGKRDVEVLEVFLKKHYHSMPRTMLRYAVERFSEKRRMEYLKGLV